MIAKLGRQYPFHIDRSPKPYSAVWTQPLVIDFHYGGEGQGKSIPDIIDNNGRLFFSEAAVKVFRESLSDCGEFLPVTYKEGTGYVFNPLKTAEEVDGINDELVCFDAHDNLESFQFHTEKVSVFPVFRTKLDTYLGIFCNEEFKSKVESHGLTGISFGEDISNPIGEPYGVSH